MSFVQGNFITKILAKLFGQNIIGIDASRNEDYMCIVKGIKFRDKIYIGSIKYIKGEFRNETKNKT